MYEWEIGIRLLLLYIQGTKTYMGCNQTSVLLPKELHFNQTISKAVTNNVSGTFNKKGSSVWVCVCSGSESERTD